MIEPAGHRRPKGMNLEDRIRQIKDESAIKDGGSDWIDARKWFETKDNRELRVLAAG
ncbi:hypothetical protein N9W89_13970 [Hellea sp.]|nr:hypothetical protein [Hellea sp.]